MARIADSAHFLTVPQSMNGVCISVLNDFFDCFETFYHDNLQGDIITR